MTTSSFHAYEFLYSLIALALSLSSDRCYYYLIIGLWHFLSALEVPLVANSLFYGLEMTVIAPWLMLYTVTHPIDTGVCELGIQSGVIGWGLMMIVSTTLMMKQVNENGYFAGLELREILKGLGELGVREGK